MALFKDRAKFVEMQALSRWYKSSHLMGKNEL